MCVMCSTSVPTLFQYFFYDHIPTFLYIFHEMFFIACVITPRGVLLPIYKHEHSARGQGLINRNSTTRGVIMCLLVAARQPA